MELSAGEELGRGRESYAGSHWAGAYASLTRADELDSLSADDLVLLAISAYMLGREDECLRMLERVEEEPPPPQPLSARNATSTTGVRAALT